MNEIVNIDRVGLRECFQPSRVILGVVHDPANNRPNKLTIAFNMCSSLEHKGIHPFAAIKKSAKSIGQRTEDIL